MNIAVKIEIPSDETAEALAQEILIWIAGDIKLLERFLDLSGLKAGEIRAMIGKPELYAGLTGFLMNHEPTLLDFCSATNNRVEWVQACHRHFVSPELSWT
jgi:hypothetical protein